MRLSITMSNGYAFAEAEYIDERVRLLKGSTIQKETGKIANKLQTKKEEAVGYNKLVEVENNLYELTEDIVFGTPSGAASFVTGVSTNGREVWQVYDEEKEAPVSLNHYRLIRGLPKKRGSSKNKFSHKTLRKGIIALTLSFQERQEKIPFEVISSLEGTKEQMIEILEKYDRNVKNE